MFIKFFLLFVFLYHNYLFAEAYIQNLEIINDNGMPIHYHVEVAKTYEEPKTVLMHRKKPEENTEWPNVLYIAVDDLNDWVGVK